MTDTAFGLTAAAMLALAAVILNAACRWVDGWKARASQEIEERLRVEFGKQADEQRCRDLRSYDAALRAKSGGMTTLCHPVQCIRRDEVSHWFLQEVSHQQLVRYCVADPINDAMRSALNDSKVVFGTPLWDSLAANFHMVSYYARPMVERLTVVFDIRFAVAPRHPGCISIQVGVESLVTQPPIYSSEPIGNG